jgi:predicted enzyme related to lactoylglutathione lyase
MAEATSTVANKPAWVDLASSDPAASREFYAKLFGWQIDVSPDPQYGGYGMARIGGKDVAGIGPKMNPDAPTAWSLYIGTTDAAGVADKVQAAGGTVVAPAFEVGDQGRMAVFQDPVGAFISAWQPAAMGTFESGVPNSFAWAELNARGFDRAVPFYEKVFGWTTKTSDMGEGNPPYTEFQLDGVSLAGGMEMMQMVPADVPSHWLLYFGVADVDTAFKAATAAGASEQVAPRDFPGGRFAVVTDPQMAAFGLLQMNPR